MTPIEVPFPPKSGPWRPECHGWDLMNVISTVFAGRPAACADSARRAVTRSLDDLLSGTPL